MVQAFPVFCFATTAPTTAVAGGDASNTVLMHLWSYCWMKDLPAVDCALNTLPLFQGPESSNQYGSSLKVSISLWRLTQNPNVGVSEKRYVRLSHSIYSVHLHHINIHIYIYKYAFASTKRTCSSKSIESIMEWVIRLLKLTWHGP